MKIDYQLFTQTEQIVSIKNKPNKTISVCNEQRYGDQRVSLSPTHALEIHRSGYQVIVEKGAGIASGFSDRDYKAVGVQVVDDKQTIFKSDVVCCLNIPLLSEINMMRPKTVLVSEFQLRRLNDQVLQSLLVKEITTLSLEHIYDNNQEKAYYRIMSDLFATSIPTMASQIYLERKTLFGGVSGFHQPSLAIFGAGMTGEKVGELMNQFGFDLTYFDDSMSNIRQIQKRFNNAFKTNILPCHTSRDVLSDFDIIIFTKEFDRFLLDHPMFDTSHIKADALVLDLAFDYSGNLQVFKQSNLCIQKVNHYYYGLINDFSKLFPISATPIISHFLYSYAIKISRFGSLVDFIKYDSNFARALITYRGVVCNPNVADKFELPLYEIDFIIDSL